MNLDRQVLQLHFSCDEEIRPSNREGSRAHLHRLSVFKFLEGTRCIDVLKHDGKRDSTMLVVPS
jgi:hypothetical protein